MYPKNEENDVFHVVAMVIKMATLEFLKPDGLLTTASIDIWYKTLSRKGTFYRKELNYYIRSVMGSPYWITEMDYYLLLFNIKGCKNKATS